MGIHDFLQMFDMIDVTCKGHVTAGQLHAFCENIYYLPVSMQHVEGAVKVICGAESGPISRENFIQVLQEVDRRRTIDEQAYWDFQALDYTGKNRISLKNALLMFKDFHGKRFSLATWRRFLQSRDDPDVDVYYDEIRFWLCMVPSGAPCTDKELKEEGNKMELRQIQHRQDEYHSIKRQQEDMDSQQKERQDYEEETNRHARRKLDKWNKQGLEAMLFDDGLEPGEGDMKVKVRDNVTMADLTDLLERKYNGLRDRLMMEMARFAADMESEQLEILQQLRREERHTRRDTSMINHLPGGRLQLPSTLLGLMGDLKLEDKNLREQMQTLRAHLSGEGKTQAEISTAIKMEYENHVAGDVSCASVLYQLHGRHQKERQAMLSVLQSESNLPLTTAMFVEYGHLMHQILVLEEEATFVTSATSVGLTERAGEPQSDRSDWDRQRSERLANSRLQERKGGKQVRTPHEPLDVTTVEELGVLDLQIEVVKEITRKHFYEREALVYMLQSKDGASQQEKARKLPSEERKRQLKSLQNQHKAIRSQVKVDTTVLLKLLKEAVSLYFENRRVEVEHESPNISKEEMNGVVLSDLQQRQGTECVMLVQGMQYKGRDELKQYLLKENTSRIHEYFDNIAYIVLGTLEITPEDEEYIQALEEKYEAIRMKIFFLALRDQFGEEWDSLRKEEKKKELKTIKKAEKKLRSQGQMEEMADIIGPKSKILPPLKYLMGEEKSEFRERLVKQRQTGQIQDEKKVDMSQVKNVLADLVPRYDNEQDTLLSWLRSSEARSLQLRSQRLKVVEIKLETYRVKLEEDFETATVSVGLMERIGAVLHKRHPGDIQRQINLATMRAQARFQRQMDGGGYTKEPPTTDLPEKGDITRWQIVVLHEMLKRHADERELLLRHLQDENIGELIEAAEMMTDEERNRRLSELKGKRMGLNLDNSDDRDEAESILEEASAIKCVCKMKQTTGSKVNMKEVIVGLLTELQDDQDKELALALQTVDKLGEDALRAKYGDEREKRGQGSFLNVVLVFTRSDGGIQDLEVIKALEDKYHVLQEKLLIDSLVDRMGYDNWQALSEAEQQQKLTALKIKSEEQQISGQLIPGILGAGFALDHTLMALMGMVGANFFVLIRQQELAGTVRNLHLPEEEDPKGDKKNPLMDLHRRMEVERNAIEKQLTGQSEKVLSERDLQILLVCLRHQTQLASSHKHFPLATMMVGVMERQQAVIKFRLMDEPWRYQRLAKDQMMTVLKQNVPEKDDVNRSGNILQLLESVLELLDRKHHQERQLFCKLLNEAVNYPDVEQMAALSSHQKRQDMLAELAAARQKSVQAKGSEDIPVLQEATVIKHEDRCAQLSAMEDFEISRDEGNFSLMGELLEFQSAEVARVLDSTADKTEDDLIQLQVTVIAERKSGCADNIALIVFSPDRTEGAAESDLIEALKGKYDALKDQLLIDALINQLGENEWNRLTEKERQRRLIELKLKERKLRKEGKYEEASALLAELLKDQENLKKLMGDTEEEQRRKLKERLRMRKMRLAQGMSEEECDRLEAEDIAAEEEEEKKKRNILLDLEHRFDEERDELLRRIQGADDDYERERERQANLARLRREQRLARQEGNFGSAALILGLAEKHDKDYQHNKEDERRRQERLAKERLEAARNRRLQGKPNEGENESGEVDTDDITSLMEALARGLDKKHRKERDFFMKFLDEHKDGSRRNTARGMSTEERQEKMEELKEMYSLWLKSDDRTPGGQMDIFKEAVGNVLEQLKHNREFDGLPASDYDLQVALIADLQEVQDRESRRFLVDMEDKDLKSLQQLHRAQTLVDKEDRHDNIGTVLLGQQEVKDMEMDNEKGDKTLVKALEDKYDAIREKLLLEALIKEHGEAEWAKLTEKERQKRLVQLKLKERRLRREGKFDEIANIIGQHLQDEKILEEILGEKRLSQKEKLQKRLARRKELIAERKDQGLDVDDATIDAIVDEEERQEEEINKKRRKNILLELQNVFDSEKDALMSALAKQESNISRERERQIAMARLKRDQRRLQKESKLECVADIMNSAKEQDRNREQKLSAERERQRALAKQRLEERKNRKDKKRSRKDDELEELEEIMQEATEGRTVHEALLETIDNRQEEEMEMMMALLEVAKTETKQIKTAKTKNDEDLKFELTRLHQEQMKSLKKSKKKALSMNEDEMTDKDRADHMSEVAQYKSEQLKLLTEAMVYRQEVERRQIGHERPDLDSNQVEEEVDISIMSDLDEKQKSEVRAAQKLLEKQDDRTLREVRKLQHIGHREGWYDNLTNALFQLSQRDADDDDMDDLTEEIDAKLAEMDLEFQDGKEEAIEEVEEPAIRNAKPGDPVDRESVLKRLEEEHAAKKRAVEQEMKLQRELTMEKLDARRRLQSNREYEDMAAAQMVRMAEQHEKLAADRMKHEKGKHSSLLQKRLEERRRARQEAKGVRLHLQAEDTGLSISTPSPLGSRQGTTDSMTPAPSPFGMMKRERTVVADVTPEQQQAQLSKLMMQQKQLQSKMASEQERQQELLQRRLQSRKGKKEDEAAELLSLGQRQKTILEKSKQDEKDRQLSSIQERVRHVKQKRETSPKKFPLASIQEKTSDQ